jgi:signal transduction histidine kinase
VKGHDELTRLAQSFNTTLDALERSVAAQRNLVADASHELRTPIASLRANIQMLRDAERLPEVEREKLRDPIVLFRDRAMQAGVLSDDDAKKIEKDVNDLVDEAVAFADASPEPPASELFTDIFKERA